MVDKQNKGIGAYKDRPGYFLGGMIGGAILGALVNKVQGKDWKRGALWGGITGGLGSHFLGGTGWAKAGGAPSWIGKMNPGIMQSLATWGASSPHVAGATLGLGASYMAGDPAYDEEKWRRRRAEEEAKRKAEQRKAYKYWHTNPWATGGAVNARPGYYNGGSLEYTDPDLYTPTGEGGGPSSNPIQQIPLGPEGSFADEFEDLDMASASDPMDEWNQMYENYLSKGGRPMPLPDFIEMMTSEGDFTPDYGAQGGYKTRPKYQGGGTTMTDEEKANVKGLMDIGYSEDEAIQLVLNPGPEFLKSPSLGQAKGGIADLDMTGGGASFGPGTGTSDDIPAMLSDGEFVVTANAVKNLGGGDRMLGARKMYSMMNQLDPDSQTPAEMSTVGMA